MSNNNYDFEEEREERFKRFEEWEREELRKKGVKVPVSILGDSVHVKTARSYEDLNVEMEDNAYLASRRPAERTKFYITEVNGKPPKIVTIIRRILRLKEKGTDNEYLVYDYEEHFRNLMGNHEKLWYRNAGAYEEVYGSKRKTINGKVIDAVKEGSIIKFEIPFSKKALEDIMKKHSNNTDELNVLDENNLVNKRDKSTIIKEQAGQPALGVGYARTKGSLYARSPYVDRTYSIKNLDDFKNGTHEQLWEMGERGLSTEKQSLERLKSPVLSDPVHSLWRKNLGIQQVIAAQQE
jgi:hypothetical protein